MSSWKTINFNWTIHQSLVKIGKQKFEIPGFCKHSRKVKAHLETFSESERWSSEDRVLPLFIQKCSKTEYPLVTISSWDSQWWCHTEIIQTPACNGGRPFETAWEAVPNGRLSKSFVLYCVQIQMAARQSGLHSNSKWYVDITNCHENVKTNSA